MALAYNKMFPQEGEFRREHLALHKEKSQYEMDRSLLTFWCFGREH